MAEQTNYKDILKKIVDKANMNVQQQCGLKPFRTFNLEDRDTNSAYLMLLEFVKNDDLWKALFGFAMASDTVIKGILYPNWKYHLIKSCRDKGGITMVYRYLKENI